MNLPHEIQPEPQRSRDRTLLVLIVVLFLGSALVAVALRFAGLQPPATRQHGELLAPYGDLRTVVPQLAGGGDYRWQPGTRTWRILVVPPENCAAKCAELTRQLDLVWRLFGHNADRVHVLWAGAWPQGGVRNEALRIIRPDPALRAALPRVDGAPGERAGVPVYVVDPNGFVILRYAPGFDPGHLREDVARLLKLR